MYLLTAHVHLTLPPYVTVLTENTFDQHRSDSDNEARRLCPRPVSCVLLEFADRRCWPWPPGLPVPVWDGVQPQDEMLSLRRHSCLFGAARSVPARRTTQHPVSKLLLEARIEPFHQFMPTLYNKKRKERNNTNRGRWVDVLSTARSEAPGCSNSYNTLFKHQETHQHFYQISSEACLRQTAVGGVTVESQEKLCL